MRLTESLQRKISANFILPAPAKGIFDEIAKIHHEWPDITPDISEVDQEELIQEMLRHLEKYEWAGVRVSFVVKVAYVVFSPTNRNREDLAPLRHFYYEEIKVSDRRSLLNAFFKIYLESFQQGSEHTRLLAEALGVNHQSLGVAWQKLIALVPDILNPLSAPQALADRMIDMSDIYQGMKELGIYNPHMLGLMNEAHLRFLAMVHQNLYKRDEMERMMNWLKPEGREAKEVGAAEAITALIRVWNGRSPSKDDVSFLTKKLVSIYGDPRIRKTSVWGQVPEDARRTFFRWLAGNDIRFFLDVVSNVERDVEDGGNMWETRRKFWLDLFDEGRIDDAWVAFSDDGWREARRIRQSLHDDTTMQYAKQIAGGYREKTSLLIMRIGRKIVVEGSHSYKVYVFDENEPEVPKMHERRYDCDRVRNIDPDRGIVHIGNWQQKVLLKI